MHGKHCLSNAKAIPIQEQKQSNSGFWNDIVHLFDVNILVKVLDFYEQIVHLPESCFAEPPKQNSDVAKVWTLSANDILDDDIELIDDDALLDEEDLKRPDPASLRGNGSSLVFLISTRQRKSSEYIF